MKRVGITGGRVCSNGQGFRASVREHDRILIVRREHTCRPVWLLPITAARFGPAIDPILRRGRQNRGSPKGERDTKSPSKKARVHREKLPPVCYWLNWGWNPLSN